MRRQPALVFALALVGMGVGPSAFAQVPASKAPAPKPFKLGEAIGAPGWLKISGSVRPRYETLTNTLVAGRSGGDEFFSVQSLLKVEAQAGDFLAGGELLDSRLLSGNARGGVSTEIDALEAAQLYGAWRPKDFLLPDANLDLTVGRFTLDVGSRRLIARANYRSILQSFDGARAVWGSDNKYKFMAFYTQPTTRLPSDIPSALDNEVVLNNSLDKVHFNGANLEGHLPYSVVGEVYVYDLNEKDAPGNATRNRDLSTVGARLLRAPAGGRFDFDLEYAGQTGSVRASTTAADIIDLDHDANVLHAQIGYTFDAPWSPRFALQYDQASGDKSPGDRLSQRFDPLFGDRAFEFGPTSIYGVIARTNLISPGVRVEVKPDKLSDANLSVRLLQLKSATDSFANTNVRDAASASGDEAGTQIELRYRRWLVPDSVRLQIGGAAVLNGEFLDMAPNATREGDTLFGYTDITWTF